MMIGGLRCLTITRVVSYYGRVPDERILDSAENIAAQYVYGAASVMLAEAGHRE